MSASKGAGARSIGRPQVAPDEARSRGSTPANDTASIASVGPGPMVAASRPAIAGPMMKPSEKMTSKYEFARPIWLRPTSAGTDAV